MNEKLISVDKYSNKEVQLENTNSDVSKEDIRKITAQFQGLNIIKETQSIDNKKDGNFYDIERFENNISPLISPNLDVYKNSQGEKVTFKKKKFRSKLGLYNEETNSRESGSFQTNTYSRSSVTGNMSSLGNKQAKKRNIIEEAIDYAPCSTHHEIVFPFSLEKETFDIVPFQYYYCPSKLITDRNYYSFRHNCSQNVIIEENENEEIDTPTGKKNFAFEDIEPHNLLQNDLILYTELQAMIKDLEQIKYYNPHSIRTPLIIYPIIIFIVIISVVGLTLLCLYCSNSKDIMLAFISSLVMLCVLCTIMLTCASKKNNSKCIRRDEQIRNCLDKWNKDVFIGKDAKVVAGKLGAWLVLQIEEEHFLKNFC